MLELEVLVDPTALASRAAELVGAHAEAAIAERGMCALAFSGGRGPGPFLAALGARSLPWERVHAFQVDERVAPDGHRDRNLDALLEHLPAARVHPMPVTDDDLHRAAARYGALIDEVCGGVLDVVHLGLGEDGHTASWPPGEELPPGDAPVVGTGPFNGRLRMTLTPFAVNRAHWRMFLVEGAAKAPALARLLARDPQIPAFRVRPDGTLVLADESAA